MDAGAGGSGDAEPPFRSGDPDVRRRLRHEYRNLIADTQKNRLDLIKPDNTGLTDVLLNADRLFEQVRENNATQEAALDSHLMVLVSTLGKQRAQKLQTDFVVFEPAEFAEKLVTYMKGRQLGTGQNQNQDVNIRAQAWKEMGQKARHCMRRAPAFHFMLGSFDRERRVKPVKQKPDQNALSEKTLGPAVVPKQLQTMTKGHQEVTTEEVEKMLGILRQVTNYTGAGKPDEVEPVSYFEFVVNPHSFSQTVENMFHLAFLVKDGHAEVDLDEDKLPVVIPTQPYIEGQSQQRIEKKQVIVDIDMQQWKEVIKVFNITEPLIPTRAVDPVVNGHDSSPK
ncbi:non-structural maintenance of chromosomes element 4 homolog A-like isoform X2 [Amphiura filiformis]